MDIVFVIMLAFGDFDECWNYFHAKGMQDQQIVMACTKVDQALLPDPDYWHQSTPQNTSSGTSSPYAPETSLRPRMRP